MYSFFNLAKLFELGSKRTVIGVPRKATILMSVHAGSAGWNELTQ